MLVKQRLLIPTGILCYCLIVFILVNSFLNFMVQLHLVSISVLDVLISSFFFPSIRAMCGKDLQRNCVHGSDSLQSAQREISFFFKEKSSGKIFLLFNGSFGFQHTYKHFSIEDNDPTTRAQTRKCCFTVLNKILN